MCAGPFGPAFFVPSAVGACKAAVFFYGPYCQSARAPGLEIRAPDEKGLVAIPFPCPRTNASDWINSDLGTRVCMRPVRWRFWQKAQIAATAPFDDAVNWRERLLA